MSALEVGSAKPYDRVKRAADVVIAGGALIALAPVMLATALVVRLGLGSPVFFRQERPGKGGATFEVLKFRTMRDMDPARGLVTDEQRMTPLGDRLRASSLDELPSLLNVLRGDMSLVGPRPLRTRYLERYSSEQMRRHDVLPGLTGAAQIAGRNALSWDDRFDLDLDYVCERSAREDLRILLATVPKVLRREGISETGRATMSDFYGPRRIGDDALCPTTGSGSTEEWEVVGRWDGDLRARAVLTPAGDGILDLDLAVEPGCTDPARIRAHGVEMLLGVAREQGARAIRLRAGDGAGLLPERLGLRRDLVLAGDTPGVLVRSFDEEAA